MNAFSKKKIAKFLLVLHKTFWYSSVVSSFLLMQQHFVEKVSPSDSVVACSCWLQSWELLTWPFFFFFFYLLQHASIFFISFLSGCACYKICWYNNRNLSCALIGDSAHKKGIFCCFYWKNTLLFITGCCISNYINIMKWNKIIRCS